jgi:hypothetical protein
VAGDEHGLAVSGQIAEEPAQPADPLGIQPVRRLVEDDRLGVAEEGGREAEPLTHTHRVAAGPLAGRRRDADQLEHLVDATVRDPRGRREDAQVVATGASWVEVRRLEGGADLAQGVRDVVVGDAADGGGARGRADQAQQHSQRGGLAGPVRTEEAGDAPGLDREVELLHRREVTEPLGEVAYLDAGTRCRPGRHEMSPLMCMPRSNQRRSSDGSDGRVIRGRFRVRSGSYPRRRAGMPLKRPVRRPSLGWSA